METNTPTLPSSTTFTDESSGETSQYPHTKGWKEVISLVTGGTAVAVASKYGLGDAVSNSSIVQASGAADSFVRAVLSGYAGIAIGATFGSALATSANKTSRVVRAGLDLGAVAVLATSTAYLNHKMAGALLAEGMRAGLSEPKALVFGVYAGTRVVALNSPYEPVSHPAMSASPLTRAKWFLGQKARGNR